MRRNLLRCMILEVGPKQTSGALSKISYPGMFATNLAAQPWAKSVGWVACPRQPKEKPGRPRIRTSASARLV